MLDCYYLLLLIMMVITIIITILDYLNLALVDFGMDYSIVKIVMESLVFLISNIQ